MQQLTAGSLAAPTTLLECISLSGQLMDLAFQTVFCVQV